MVTHWMAVSLTDACGTSERTGDDIMTTLRERVTCPACLALLSSSGPIANTAPREEPAPPSPRKP